MAVVYRALQVNLQRQVALKILTDELARDDEFVARFFNEARAAAALSHPHIIQAYDAGVAEGDIYYFAMEYVAGETLLQRIDREGTLDSGAAVGIALDIAGALAHGWERQRLTHGDIKPENIMVNTNGETKLADFGLAKVQGHDFDAEDVMLTPLYAAPEVIRGERAKSDCRADIYAFGATLYHMLAGTPPFPGEDPRDVMRRHLEEPLVPLASRNAAVSQRLSELVGHLLAKEPGSRPADWEVVAGLLKKLRAHRGRRLSVPRAVTKAGSRNAASRMDRRPKARSGVVTLAFWAGGLAVAAAIVAGVVVSNRRGQPPEPPQAPEAPSASPGSDWVKLKGRIAGLHDPALNLRLLEEFQAKHGTDVPADFEWYMKEYRKRVATAAAKARAEAARLLAPRVKSVQADAEGTEGRTEQAAVLDRVDALLRDEGLGAKDREKLAALRLRLQQAIGADAAPPAAADAGAGASDAADRPADAGVAVFARADAYVELTEEVSLFRYDGQKELEPLARAARDWLDGNPGESPERQRVQFLLETVLPAAEEFLPRLVTRQAKLVGQRMPGRKGRKYAGKTVKAVSLEKLDLVEQTQYGKAVVQVAWSALDRPSSYMAYFGKLVFAAPGAPDSDRRNYLALLLLTSSVKAMTSALGALPPESHEAAMWRALSADIARAEQEGDALRQWREARKCCERGEFVNGYRLLQRLKSAPSEVYTRYARGIDGWLERCLPRVPEAKAAELVRRAQEQLSLAPAEALALATTAHTRYGLLEFPEKAAINTVRGTAVRAHRTQWHEPMFRRPARSLAPFLGIGPRSYDHRVFPGLSLLLCEEATSDQGLRPALPLLRELAKLEVGDWLGAKGLVRRPASEAKGLPAELRPCFWFGRGLVGFRYDAASRVVGEGTAGLKAARAGDEPPVAAVALGVEYALLTAQFDGERSPWPAWSDLTKQQQEPHMKRFCLAALAWLLEAGRAEDAVRALRKITDSENSLTACGFLAFERPIVEGLATYLESGVGVVVPQWRTHDAFSERYVRLLVSALASRPPTDPTAGEQVLSAAAERPGRGPIGGAAWFDSLLLRLAAALGSGDLAGAADQAQEALEATDVSVVSYYPRLCMLQAGFEFLSGRDATARETLVSMRLSPVASQAELLCANAMQADDGSPSPRGELAAGDPNRFWLAWLRLTANRNGDTAAAGRSLGRMETSATSLSQKRFATSLRSLELGPG